MDDVYSLLMTAAMAVLGVCLFVCLFRAFRGPTPADRVIAVNMTGTIVITMILFLSLLLREGYLVDIALIYAMLSFLAVVLLCRISIGAYKARKEKEENRHA